MLPSTRRGEGLKGFQQVDRKHDILAIIGLHQRRYAGIRHAATTEVLGRYSGRDVDITDVYAAGAKEPGPQTLEEMFVVLIRHKVGFSDKLVEEGQVYNLVIYGKCPGDRELLRQHH